MASGKVPFSHEGSKARFNAISANSVVEKFAENLALGHQDASRVVQGWLDSPGHRENIDGDFTHMDVGIFADSEGVRYFTQIFIRAPEDAPEPVTSLVKMAGPRGPASALEFEQQVWEVVNQYRVSVGKPQFARCGICRDMARTHSQRMARGKVEVGHSGSEQRFKQIRARVAGNGFAENISMGHVTAEAVLKDWLGDARLKKSIDAEYTHMDVGAARDTEGVYYITQIFVRAAREAAGSVRQDPDSR